MRLAVVDRSPEECDQRLERRQKSRRRLESPVSTNSPSPESALKRVFADFRMPLRCRKQIECFTFVVPVNSNINSSSPDDPEYPSRIQPVKMLEFSCMYSWTHESIFGHLLSPYNLYLRQLALSLATKSNNFFHALSQQAKNLSRLITASDFQNVTTQIYLIT